MRLKFIFWILRQFISNYLFKTSTWVHLPKTILFNLKYLPFKQAIFLPIYISRTTKIKKINKYSIKLHGYLEPKKIKIGFPIITIFDPNERTMLEILGKVELHGYVVIGHGSAISVRKSGFLSINDNFVATSRFKVICAHEIYIGEGCLFSWNVTIMDSDLHPIFDSKSKLLINEDKAIFIASKNWIGADVSILKGTRTAENIIVGTRSVLIGEYTSPNTIIAGIPAKVIKEDIFWKP